MTVLVEGISVCRHTIYQCSGGSYVDMFMCRCKVTGVSNTLDAEGSVDNQAPWSVIFIVGASD